MKYLKYLVVGSLFGIILTKTEMISWYRWQELFLFDSFRIVGIILSAVTFGAIGIAIIKKLKLNDIYGNSIQIESKKMSRYRYPIGGFIFGLGWALVGCPGVHYTLIGQGVVSIFIVLFSALLGTFIYGAFRTRLPH